MLMTGAALAGTPIKAAINSFSVRPGDASGTVGGIKQMGIAVFGSGPGFTAVGPGEPTPLSPAQIPPNVLPGGFDTVVASAAPDGFTAAQYDAAVPFYLLGTWSIWNDAASTTGTVPAGVFSSMAARQQAEFTVDTLNDFIARGTAGFTGSITFSLKAARANAVSVAVDSYDDATQTESFVIVGTIPAGSVSATLAVNLPAGLHYGLAALINTGGNPLAFSNGATVTYWQTTATVYDNLVGGNPCFGDLDASGAVDNGDVALALLDFGQCPGCPSDVDGTGEVDFGDVALILLAVGPCQ
jgi:hypothetical protein